MNKKIKYLMLLLLIVVTCILDPPKCSQAAGASDEIQSYNITVDVRDDGSLDMNYKISWEVLDSDSEGPREWVKIGVPNKHVDEIKALSDNIQKAYFYEDSDGIFIRIDFTKKYYAGEIIDFEYSFHQECMYIINGFTKKVTYKFTPGWFDDIYIKDLYIKWNSKNIKDASTNCIDGDYYYWRTFLTTGRKYKTSVTYDSNAYNFREDKQVENEKRDKFINNGFLSISIGIFAVIFFFWCLKHQPDEDE
jgi:hypothetical protein